jgi:hypothetical protein
LPPKIISFWKFIPGVCPLVGGAFLTYTDILINVNDNRVRNEKAKRGKKMTIFPSIIIALVIAIITMLLYYNRAFPEPLDIAGTMDKVGNDYYFHGDSKVGFIIFAGAKADEKSYSYIAKLLHDEGHTVVIPKVPFHLSAFGIDHGSTIMEDNPQVEKWILVGHSLGGLPVSRIAAKQPDKLLGIALLATMASRDLSGLDISAIRITAENDRIMSNKMMDSYLGNLPKNSLHIELKGANHQGFAAYNSFMSRDGEATITWQEQNEETVRLILDFFDARITEVSTGGQ